VVSLPRGRPMSACPLTDARPMQFFRAPARTIFPEVDVTTY
jgi:hypothetical protein